MRNKKSKIKFAVKKAMAILYKQGMTNTAYTVYKQIINQIDHIYDKK